MNSRYKSSSVPKKSPGKYNPPSQAYQPISNPKKITAGQNIASQQLTPDSRVARSGGHNGSYGSTLSKNESQPQELLVMTIDLGDGSKDLLRVFEGDDPFQLAQSFCERHQLNFQLVEPLAQNIYGNMEQVLQESVQTLNFAGPNRQTEQVQELRHSVEGGQDTGKFRNIGEVAQNERGGSHYENIEERESHQSRKYEEDLHRDRFMQRNEYERNERRDADLRGRVEERISQKHHPPVRESANSRKYEEEPEMYEMIDHDDNAGLIAERVSPKHLQNYMRNGNGNGLTEKDLRMSKGRREEYQEPPKPKMMSPQMDQRIENAHFRNTDNEKRRINSDYPSDQKIGKSWTSGEEFHNEEEYLDYLVTSQYGQGKEKPPGRYDLTFVPNINQNSKQMLEHKFQGGKPNVYDRLHEEAKIKNYQQSGLRQSHSAKKTNTSTIQSQQGADINYGVLLYHRGLKKSEAVKQQLIEKRKEKLELNHKECTFKPELNRISQQIMSAKARYENIPDKLIRSGKDSKDKLERARSAKKVKEMEECTFRPEINFISQRIDSEKSKMTNNNQEQARHSRLFQEAIARQGQQEMVSRLLPPDCTFTPAINNYRESTVNQTTFEERDKKFRDRMERINYMRQLKEEAEVRDPETGEPLFRPKTGRSPKTGRNSRNLPIGDYLYSQQYRIAENKRRMQENWERNREANMARSNDMSHAIVENLMRRRLEDIFIKFDSDGDGYISSAKIDITHVGNDVLETLAPILCEMEERNQILDFEGFTDQIERLFRFLTVAEKDSLLLGKKEVQNTSYSFQPEIDKRSEKIAQRKHPYGNFHSLYGSYINERTKFTQKMRDEQERKTQAELKECSFRPIMYTSPKASNTTPSTKRYGQQKSGNNYFLEDFHM